MRNQGVISILHPLETPLGHVGKRYPEALVSSIADDAVVVGVAGRQLDGEFEDHQQGL
ncbi:hypothetical protein CISG_06140 [Coccidioides immitis RMSCC 3703]|uniref:Uncharacterized protein n=2 Tax=Coccidioides immitis TaxID=5501 RepID=A0A0J8TTJ7_COCIT|nr:hypothetical protein CIRG_10075 [Coccidioides immitis RMSCC 2394]KMU77102.1 hypothetical protein CISG_06140 [Coccidioides immitis RMSCC 3703]